MSPAPPPEWVVTSALLAAFVLYTHRANVQRLRAGNQHRFEKARLLARLFGR